MRPIRFTAHALEKLRIVRGSGFQIDETTVTEAIRSPQLALHGYGGRSIAQVILDEQHVSRVIYEGDGEFNSFARPQQRYTLFE